jgi:hypothetical protein
VSESVDWSRETCEHVLRSPGLGEPAKEKARARLAELDETPVTAPTPPRRREVCRKPLDEELNQTERDFREVLERFCEPDPAWDPYWEKPLAQRLVFRLAPGVSYQPDFALVKFTGTLWLFEVKGAHTWDDAKDRFKMAAEAFPWWRWTMVRRKKRGEPWEVVYDRGAGATGQLTFADTQRRAEG